MPAIISRGGLTIGFEVVGDPQFVFIHANGFCKETWHPVIDELGAPGHVSIDQPGHGASEAPEPPFDWWDFGRNALDVLAATGADRLIGVGHSSGAATLAMAEILCPGTFDRLVLVEPIIPPPPYERVEQHPLITGALRRRTLFESPDDAIGSYRGRGPFELWEERALQAYVTHGFEAVDGGWRLLCSPEVEAEVYRSSAAHGAWERVSEIGCDVDLVAGEASDTHHAEFAQRQAERFEAARLHIVPGAGHFVPMEQPAALARIILGH